MTRLQANPGGRTEGRFKRYRPRKTVSSPSPLPSPHEDNKEKSQPLRSGIGNEGEEEEQTCSRVTHEPGAADRPPPVAYILYQHLMELLEAFERLELLGVRLVGSERQLHLRLRVPCQGVERLVSVEVDGEPKSVS